MQAQNIDLEYRRLLSRILFEGFSSSPRGMETREALAHQTRIEMTYPYVTHPDRRISNKFRFAEAAWILSGDNRVSTIAPFNKNISPFADDGHRYFGAYGPKVVDQLPYVVAKLAADKDTRQAVINIWRENPPATKDVPCTLSLQFFIRNHVLHCVATMRSSDAWLGWPYDVFNFSMVARAVSIYLRNVSGRSHQLGSLFLTAGSQHIYSKNFDKAKQVVQSSIFEGAGVTTDPMLPESFATVDEFVNYLWERANESQADPR